MDVCFVRSCFMLGLMHQWIRHTDHEEEGRWNTNRNEQMHGVFNIDFFISWSSLIIVFVLLLLYITLHSFMKQMKHADQSKWAKLLFLNTNYYFTEITFSFSFLQSNRTICYILTYGYQLIRILWRDAGQSWWHRE